MNDIAKIRKLAYSLRNKLEKFVKKESNKLFSEKLVLSDANLTCMCAIASFALCKLLRKNGIRAKMIYGNYLWNGYGEDHCWVECRNKIIDLTATQFNVENRVLITDASSKNFKKIRQITSKYKWRDWPPEQRPRKRILSEVLE